MSQTDQSLLVSVVIVCHNDGKWLERCVESLRTQTIANKVEVIVADNASTDGTDALARTLLAGWKNARFLPTGGDKGFAFACNLGAEAARGDYLYLLSPDTWLESDCLEQFYACCEREQAAGAGGTILEYDNSTLQARGSHGFDLFGNPVSPRLPRIPKPLFCIAGFAFIRREVYLGLGCLDQMMFMYGEEIDLAWRIWLSGRRLVAAPLAITHHRGAVLVNPAGGCRIVENRTSTQKRFLANRNAILVVAKNCQSILLLMLLPCALLILSEWIATLILTRRWVVAKETCLAAFRDSWRLRHHIWRERIRIRSLRRRSDFWMLRFLHLGFGRWGELKKIAHFGFPKIARDLDRIGRAKVRAQ